MGFVLFFCLDLSSFDWLELLCCNCFSGFDSVHCHFAFPVFGDLKFHFWGYICFSCYWGVAAGHKEASIYHCKLLFS